MTARAQSLPRVQWILLGGAWWAALEVGLGTALHAGGSPLVGVTMTTLGLGSAVAVARLSGAQGVILGCALVAAAAKVSLAGPMGLSPALAILMEGALAEIAFRFGREPAAMMAGLLWSSIHAVTLGRLLSGRTLEAAMLRSGELGVLLGFASGPLALIVAISGKLILGGLIGLGITRLSRR